MYASESREDITLLYKEYGTNEGGLFSDEARSRLATVGFNIWNQRKNREFLKILGRQLGNWFNVMLLLSALLSFLTGMVSLDQGSFYACTALVAVTVLNSM